LASIAEQRRGNCGVAGDGQTGFAEGGVGVEGDVAAGAVAAGDDAALVVGILLRCPLLQLDAGGFHQAH